MTPPFRSAATLAAVARGSGVTGHRVCAVTLAGVGSEASLPLANAIEHQTRKPERHLGVRAGGAGRHEDLGGVLGGEEGWLWLLDGSAVPEPTALERMLAVVDEVDDMPPPEVDDLPPPVLLASKVVRPDGSLDRPSLPVAQVGNADLAVAAFERRLLSLRVARGGSLLVHRSGLEAVASRWPRLSPFHDDLEWTARLLKGRLGLLVPTSVVVRAPAAGRDRCRPAHREVAGRIRLLLGDAVDVRDKPWFAFRFAEEGLAHVRRAPPFERGG